MSDKAYVLTEISKLHASGSLGDAHNLAQKLSKANPGDVDALNILHMMRMELLGQQQLDVLNRVSSTVALSGQSISQMLVRDILKDDKYQDTLRLERYGYSTASQNEEDGMLTEVFNRIGVTNKTFFEFGVGSGLQNNTLHFLLQGWKGWWVEINKPKVAYMRHYFKSAISSGQLTLSDTLINAENINEICELMKIDSEIDLLSIDIDGNDYHVFNAMTLVKARVVVLEFNPMYPPPMKMVGAYDAGYSYSKDTYIGASLQSLSDLANKKGYDLVGTSIGGINAIFVRKDLAAGKFFPSSIAGDFYHQGRYQLSFSGGFGEGGKACFGPLYTEE